LDFSKINPYVAQPTQNSTEPGRSSRGRGRRRFRCVDTIRHPLGRL
jgi:hypothetical protein